MDPLVLDDWDAFLPAAMCITSDQLVDGTEEAGRAGTNLEVSEDALHPWMFQTPASEHDRSSLTLNTGLTMQRSMTVVPVPPPPTVVDRNGGLSVPRAFVRVPEMHNNAQRVMIDVPPVPLCGQHSVMERQASAPPSSSQFVGGGCIIGASLSSADLQAMGMGPSRVYEAAVKPVGRASFAASFDSCYSVFSNLERQALANRTRDLLHHSFPSPASGPGSASSADSVSDSMCITTCVPHVRTPSSPSAQASPMDSCSPSVASVHRVCSVSGPLSNLAIAIDSGSEPMSAGAMWTSAAPPKHTTAVVTTSAGTPSPSPSPPPAASRPRSNPSQLKPAVFKGGNRKRSRQDVAFAAAATAAATGVIKRPSKRMSCWNCGAHNTPQWRCGPDGPRTLCNACGVRHKKGLPLAYKEAEAKLKQQQEEAARQQQDEEGVAAALQASAHHDVELWSPPSAAMHSAV